MTTKYKLVPAIGLAAALPFSASAFVPSEISVTSDITFASEYVFRGIEFADHSFQPSVEVEIGDLYVGIWSNLPTDDADNEINYFAGYAVDIPDMPFSLDVGLTVYHYPNTSSNRHHEAYIGASADDLWVDGLGVSLYYFYDFDIESQVLEAALSYGYPILDTGLTAEGVLTGGTVWGRTGVDAYNYYGVSVGLPYDINPHMTLTPAVHYATAEKIDLAEAGGRNKNLFWTISLTASF